jgi:hypothetical protein
MKKRSYKSEQDNLTRFSCSGAGSGTVTPIGGDDGGDGDGDDGPTPTPAADDAPACIAKIDAAVHWDHSTEYVYIFAGDWYYRCVSLGFDACCVYIFAGDR